MTAPCDLEVGARFYADAFNRRLQLANGVDPSNRSRLEDLLSFLFAVGILNSAGDLM